ncbi:MAG: hypothetical protein F4Y40_11835 [Acidimicrobiia bacterium]|nr:hypothetical protein [Acidimicrobiia bacterium]
MPSPDERAIEEALAELDFRAARALADRSVEADRKRLRRLVETARAEAVTRAEHLAARIQSMARADHYEGLLGLAEDSETELLLALLSPELRRGAQLHLDGALRRRKRFRAAAGRHMKAASEALALFDTRTAEGEIAKVEIRWLTTDQREELDTLRAQAERVASERLDLESRTAEVLREHISENPINPPRRRRHKPLPRSSRQARKEPPAPPERKPAGESAADGEGSGRAGCLGSALVILGTVAAPVVLLVGGF